jgi:voltage-gated potassium channel Kch
LTASVGAGPVEVGRHVGGLRLSVSLSVISSVRSADTAALMTVMIFARSISAQARSRLR